MVGFFPTLIYNNHMLFSQSCKYAIRALIHLAHNRDAPCLSRDIAHHIDVPEHFLAKILQDLARHRLLDSFKGRGGGFRLARHPDQIALMDIIEAVDGPGLKNDCVLGLLACSNESPCALHHWWGRQREQIIDVFENQSLSQFIERET